MGFATLARRSCPQRHGLHAAACGCTAVTTTLRLGSYVYANDFRHPVLLAREAAENDVRPGERMELGIGAGGQVGVWDGGRSRATTARRGRAEMKSATIVRALRLGVPVTPRTIADELEDARLLASGRASPDPLLRRRRWMHA